MIKANKIIVIGGNAAGPAAAAKAKRVNPDAEVILIEAGEYISTGTCEIPYVLSGEIESYKNIIFFDPDSFYKSKGVKVYTNHLVKNIDRKDKTLLVKDLISGTDLKFSYDKLVLATGSVAKKIPEFPEDFSNVFYLKNIRNLISAQEYIKSNKVKNVIIIGSGYIGLEAADAFRELNLVITILEKHSMPLPSAGKEVSALIIELLKNKEISFYGNSSGMRVLSTDNFVKSINLDSRLLEFDMILVAAGFVPNIELAKYAGLEIGRTGALKVDYKLRTSCQHIFAAGDNIEVQNKITNSKSYIPLATLARNYGHIAGENAVGGNKKAPPVVKNISVKIFDKFYAAVGLNANEAENEKLLFDEVRAVMPNKIEVMPGSEKTFGKIIFEKNSKRLLGAEFFGGKEVSGFADLISALIKADQTAEILWDINYNYTPPLSPFTNLLSVLGRKVQKQK